MGKGRNNIPLVSVILQVPVIPTKAGIQKVAGK